MRPLSLVAGLREGYARYVDSFQFYKNPAIREWVRDKRREGRLLYREPFLTLAKPFADGASLQTMVDEGVLHPGVLGVFTRKPGDSGSGPVSPFAHQEQAIRQIMAGHNTAVTTGTGSGKSFTFYMPIVSTALSVAAARQVGVLRRPVAVIIYPMNALANSQYEDVAARLAGTGLTVCNYTGSLKVTGEAALKDFKQLTGRDTPYDSEVIDRDTLHTKGCDILLTNFKMLEYALVRREDAALFDTLGEEGRLRYLVLDEMHTYSGHQGADMALLVRRFKARTGTDGTLRCVGTSATVDSGDPAEARATIAGFAARLFGEPFDPDYVVGESFGKQETLDPDGLHLPAQVIGQDEFATAMSAETDDGAAELLGAALLDGPVSPDAVRASRPVAWVERALWGGVVSMTDLEDRYLAEVRPGSSREDARREIEAAVVLGASVKTPGPKGDAVGLLTPKVHAFFSQGLPVTRCLRSKEPPHLSEQGESTCRQCVEDARVEDVPSYPIVFCQACGQDYFVAQDDGYHLLTRDFLAAAENAAAVYLMTDEWDEDAVPLDPNDVKKDGTARKGRDGAVPRRRVVCGTCGELGAGCGHNTPADAVTVAAPLLLCPSCGVRYDGTHSEYNKFFQVGTVGRATATDVLVEAMLDQQDSSPKPSVMAFTDNQQDSSFQAAHLRSMSRRFHVRRALVAGLVAKGATEPADALDTGEVADAAYKAMETTKTLPPFSRAEGDQAGFAPDAASGKAKGRYLRYLKTSVLLETSGGPRKAQPNLEDTGLVVVDYAGFDAGQVAPVVAGLDNFPMIRAYAESDPDLTEDLLRVILDLVRRDHAVASDNEDGPSAAFVEPDRFNSDVLEQLDTRCYFHSGQEIPLRRTVFHEKRDSNRRINYRRLAGKVNVDGSDAPQTTKLTRWLKAEAGLPQDAAGSAGAKTIIREAAAVLAKFGYLVKAEDGYVLNEEKVRYWHTPDAQGFRCVRCSARWNLSKLRACPRCVKSKVQEDRPGRDDFFRAAYLAPLDEKVKVEAEEHTGSLDGDQRKVIETRFKDQAADLNVLVCTPTMELGVDIGTLSAVYMRNVPPSPANYAQRQGRAGRAAQPSAVVTFCAAQGRAASHDQYFFKRPERIIAGKIAAPRFLLDNRALVEAHANAIVLGAYAQVHGDLPREIDAWTRLDDGIGGLIDHTRAQISGYVTGHRDELIASITGAFADVVDAAETVTDTDVADMVDRFVDKLDVAVAALVDFSAELKTELDELNAQGDKGQLDKTGKRRRDAVEAIRGSIRRGEGDYHPLSWLAQRGFLPSYAFPRKAVMLRFSDRERARVRSRSIALREFAPGNSIYHLGKRYQVTKVASGRDAEANTVPIYLCTCGHYLERDAVGTHQKCPSCDLSLTGDRKFDNAMPVSDQFAVQRDNVGADTEERLRQGYQVESAYRLPKLGVRHGIVRAGDGTELTVTFSRAGHVMQANLGLMRSNGNFSLCARCRQWNPDPVDHYNAQSECLPVQDNLIQNVVIFNDGLHDLTLLDVAAPDGTDPDVYAYTLAYALMAAMGTHFGVEESELNGTVFPVPGEPHARRILLYETDEGGIGVLDRMTDPTAWQAVAGRALDILHINPDGTEADDACLESCYECLRSFYNQWHHEKMDRTLVVPLLRAIADHVELHVAAVSANWDEVIATFDSHAEELMVKALRDAGIPAPSKAHVGLPHDGPVASADLLYSGEGLHLAVFLDGSVHDDQVVAKIDLRRRRQLQDLGFSVLEIRYDDVEAGIKSLRHRLGV